MESHLLPHAIEHPLFALCCSHDDRNVKLIGRSECAGSRGLAEAAIESHLLPQVPN